MKRILQPIFIFLFLFVLVSCNKIKYTITFIVDDKSFIQEVVENEFAKLPDEPQKDDYRFVEWQLEGEKYNFDKPVTKNITLVAVFEKLEQYFTVTFDLDGGILDNLIVSQQVTENSIIQNPGNPEKEGFIFVEWQVDNQEFDFNSPITNNLIIKAHFEEVAVVKYLVQFIVDGIEYSSYEVIEGNLSVKPEDPTKDNHEFMGWYNNDLLFDFNEPIYQNLELTAVFVLINNEKTLNIFYINDLHGAILENGSEMGLAKIANLIIETRKLNPNTIFIAGGDDFQGSALSNINFGKPIIEIFDEMGIHANILGNHEFDWGIDEILDYYRDGGIANHPLLSINTFYKDTTNLINGLDPYTIVDLPDFKVGIIGYIDDLRSSIMASEIEPYIFATPDSYISAATTYLKEVEKVDYVIVAGHNGDTEISERLSNYEIDFFFEAHTHRTYMTSLSNNKIVIQAGSRGSHVGHIELKVGNTIKKTIIYELLNQASHPFLTTANQAISQIIEQYVLESEELLKTPIITNGNYYQSRSILTEWAAKLMETYYGADIGFHNEGGTTSTIAANQVIDLELLYKVFPFDNAVVLVELTSSQMQTAYYNNNYTRSNDIEITPGRTYLVAVNQYVYEHKDNVFKNGKKIDQGINMRDLVLEELKLQKIEYGTFSIYNPFLSSIDTPFLINSIDKQSLFLQ